MFDKAKPLGRICPDILTSNIVEKDGWSVLILYLDSLDDDEFKELKESMVNVKGDMLLFTRRLRCIEAFCETKFLFSHVCSIALAPKSVATVITRKGSKKEMETQYVLQGVTFNGMPPRKTRDELKGEKLQGKTQEQRSSKVFLAFPFCSISGPIIENQSIFAFLPLRSTFLRVTTSSYHFSLFSSFYTPTSSPKPTGRGY